MKTSDFVEINKYNPNTAIGAELDEIARLCGIKRIHKDYLEADVSLRDRIFTELKRVRK
jgi:hypothetical protein